MKISPIIEKVLIEHGNLLTKPARGLCKRSVMILKHRGPFWQKPFKCWKIGNRSNTAITSRSFQCNALKRFKQRNTILFPRITVDSRRKQMSAYKSAWNIISLAHSPVFDWIVRERRVLRENH